MQPVFQQNSQRRSVRHAELLAVRARVSSQRPFLTGGGFLVLVISCGRDAAKLFPQFPGTGCFLPLAVSYRRPFPVAGRFLRLAHHPEALAVVVALGLFKDHLSGRNVVVYTDNSGVHGTFVKCWSENAVGGALAFLAAQKEFELQAFFYYDRVPSHSNPADAPSRGIVLQEGNLRAE